MEEEKEEIRERRRKERKKRVMKREKDKYKNTEYSRIKNDKEAVSEELTINKE